MPGAEGARINERQLSGGKFFILREGVVVQRASPQLPPFYWHGGENVEASL
jgi:hypothetical protein